MTAAALAQGMGIVLYGKRRVVTAVRPWRMTSSALELVSVEHRHETLSSDAPLATSVFWPDEEVETWS